MVVSWCRVVSCVSVLAYELIVLRQPMRLQSSRSVSARMSLARKDLDLLDDLDKVIVAGDSAEIA